MADVNRGDGNFKGSFLSQNVRNTFRKKINPLHARGVYMKCPICPDTSLTMADRQGIEIDYCPNCRGIWLDRGELDKIIERAAKEAEPRESRERSAPPRDERQYQSPPYQERHYQEHYPRHKKRKSLLGELFDF